jgi:DNA-binding CsgD family transcriptional regulator
MMKRQASRVFCAFRSGAPGTALSLQADATEQRLLKLRVEGHNYETAAVELGVIVNTISFHMRRIYETLHVHSKSEAVAKALRNQIEGDQAQRFTLLPV